MEIPLRFLPEETPEKPNAVMPLLPSLLSFSLSRARSSASLSLLLALEESGSTPQGLHKGARDEALVFLRL